MAVEEAAKTISRAIFHNRYVNYVYGITSVIKDGELTMNKDEQVLYDFFVTFGKGVGTIQYLINILALWVNEHETNFVYPEKQAVIDAYFGMRNMDKPLHEAIKTIKRWK